MTKDFAGVFSLTPSPTEYDFSGRLSLADKKCLLSLYTDKKIDCDPEAEFFGKIEGPKLVSLINAISNQNGMVIGSLGTEFKTKVQAFYCLSGAHHLRSDSQEVRQLTFELDQLSSLFDDQNHFQMMHGEPLGAIQDALNLEKNENHLFAHFDGTQVLAQIDTPFGIVTIENDVRHGFGNSSGINISNSILIRILFTTEVKFFFAIQKMMLLRRFLELIIGRKQNIQNINLKAFRNKKEFSLKVHAEWLDKTSSSEKTIRFDFLVNATQDQAQFENVLQNYINLENDRRNIRESFQRYSQSNLSEERLVGVANLFDVFPDGTYPNKFTLTDDELGLLEEFKQRYKALPKENKSRGSILGAIARVSKFSLRDKINHRADVISRAAPKLFPDIDQVIKSVHICRNHLVHGSDKEFEYFEHWGLVQFLTETCEIIFLFSDLIECGWDIEQYTSNCKFNTHKASRFLNGYRKNLCRLRDTVRSHSSAS